MLSYIEDVGKYLAVINYPFFAIEAAYDLDASQMTHSILLIS